jgi:hypothetical protein
MGYYVQYDGSIHIPDDRRDDILQALKDLNHRHELKRGGRFPATGDPYEDTWFSWMPAKYHETVESVEDVLSLLGFEGMERGQSRHYVHYDNKMGDERIFLQTIVQAGGEVHLGARGEDGALWLYRGADGLFQELDGEIVYS